MKAASYSEKGSKSQVNEDAFVVIPSKRFFAVADGVGGSPAGEYVSRFVIDYLFDYINDVFSPSDNRAADIECIKSIIVAAHNDVRKSSIDAGVNGAASTLAVAYMFPDELVCFHVGDSRVYQLRGDELQQVTSDHAEVVSRPNIGVKRILTRAMGVNDSVDVEVSSAPWVDGDVVVLMSDGISDALPVEEILIVLQIPGLTQSEKARQLVKMSESKGGRDDKTIVIGF